MTIETSEPVSPAGRLVTEWAVGVTTAPRPRPTLTRCLESLGRAGWACPRLFAEPGADIPSDYATLPATHRDSTLGAFPNWFLGLAELVMRQPRAEAYFLCQDDVLFAAGLRDFLERNLWPSPRVGVVSVYAPSHYPEKVEGLLGRYLKELPKGYVPIDDDEQIGTPKLK